MSSEAVRYLQHENTRLKAEVLSLQKENQHLQQYIDALATLYQKSQIITQLQDPDEALTHLNQLLELIIEVAGTKDGSVLKLDTDTNELVFVLVHGTLQHDLPGHRISCEQGVAGWVVNNCQSVIVNNPRQDWRFSFEVDEEFAFLTQSILCVPIYCEDNLLGVTELINKEHTEFTEVDLILLTVFASIAGKAFNGTSDCSSALPPTSCATHEIDV